MKVQQLFKNSKHRKVYVFLYSLASVFWFASIIFVTSTAMSGLFSDLAGTIRWQHLIRFIIFADWILILSTVIILVSLFFSVQNIWKKILIMFFGFLFIAFFYNYIIKSGISDLKTGIRTYEGNCRFDNGKRNSDGFDTIFIEINKNYEGGKRLSISSKSESLLGKTRIPGTLISDGRLFYTLCKHPIKVTYLYGLGVALTVEEDTSRTITYPQK